MSFQWRSYLVRRVLARFHIGEDILRHLSTFQRLGERLEATPPGEMAPVGVRTLLRAIRTRLRPKFARGGFGHSGWNCSWEIPHRNLSYPAATCLF